jgi:hypothetical protein
MLSGETLTDDWVAEVQVVKSQSLAVHSFSTLLFWVSVADVNLFYGSRPMVLMLRK